MSMIQVEAKTELEPWARDALEEPSPEPRAEPGPQLERAPEPAQAETADGLTPEQAGILQRMEILSPGDYKGIAMLLESFPEMRDQILARAQQLCGNETVTRALELITAEAAAPAPEPAAAEEAQPAEQAGPEAVDEVVAVTEPGAAPAQEEAFAYVLSPLTLQGGDRAQQIQDHVDFIRANPGLRDEVLIGAGELDPELAEQVRAALAEAAPPEAAPVEETPAPAEVAPAPENQAAAEAQVEEFDYTVHWLALAYDRGQQVIDHVDFIRNNPALRDAVLAGAAELDPSLADEVRAALEGGAPAPAVTETEPTPPEVVEAAAQEAAPTPEPAAEPAPAEEVQEPEPQPEAGWVTRARAYHQRHADQAAAFNEITGGSCLGPDGELDPNLVANWQVAHGVAPDGRVGEETLAASVEQTPMSYDEAVEAAEEEGLPPPDVLDPQFAI